MIRYACQSGSQDTGAAHATCCALGEATRGHNAATALVHIATAQRRLRFPGSGPPTSGNSYTARHFDVLSARQQAGPDCTQTRREAKLAYYGPHLSLTQ